MNILFLNLAATVNDSVIVKVVKIIESSQPVSSEAATSCNDVKIVGIICLTIVLVALITKWAIWSWQKAEIASKKQERDDKKKRDGIEYMRKQKSIFLDVYLQVLKDIYGEGKMESPSPEEVSKYTDNLKKTIQDVSDMLVEKES